MSFSNLTFWDRELPASLRGGCQKKIHEQVLFSLLHHYTSSLPVNIMCEITTVLIERKVVKFSKERKPSGNKETK